MSPNIMISEEVPDYLSIDGCEIRVEPLAHPITFTNQHKYLLIEINLHGDQQVSYYNITKVIRDSLKQLPVPIVIRGYGTRAIAATVIIFHLLKSKMEGTWRTNYQSFDVVIGKDGKSVTGLQLYVQYKA